MIKLIPILKQVIKEEEDFNIDAPPEWNVYSDEEILNNVKVILGDITEKIIEETKLLLIDFGDVTVDREKIYNKIIPDLVRNIDWIKDENGEESIANLRWSYQFDWLYGFKINGKEGSDIIDIYKNVVDSGDLIDIFDKLYWYIFKLIVGEDPYW